MTPVLVLLALVVTAAGVAAIGTATPRTAAMGLLIALVGATCVVDPLPSPLALAARLAGSLLAAYLVWISLRRAPAAAPGASWEWPGAAALAIVAFTAGFLASGSLAVALVTGPEGGPGLGGVGAALAGGSLVPRAALGAAIALVAVATTPVVLARDTARMGVGLMLMLTAAALVRNAFMNNDPVLDLGAAVAMALAGAAVSAVISASISRTGDVTLRETLRRDPAVRHRAADDAHRPAERNERNERRGREAAAPVIGPEAHRPEPETPGPRSVALAGTPEGAE